MCRAWAAACLPGWTTQIQQRRPRHNATQHNGKPQRQQQTNANNNNLTTTSQQPNHNHTITNNPTTNPFTTQTIDDEVFEKAKDFIERAKKAGKPFFVWFNTTHMHFRTHVKPESRGQAGRWQSE